MKTDMQSVVLMMRQIRR